MIVWYGVGTTAGHHTAELMLTLGTFSLAQEGMVVTYLHRAAHSAFEENQSKYLRNQGQF